MTFGGVRLFPFALSQRLNDGQNGEKLVSTHLRWLLKVLKFVRVRLLRVDAGRDRSHRLRLVGCEAKQPPRSDAERARLRFSFPACLSRAPVEPTPCAGAELYAHRFCHRVPEAARGLLGLFARPRIAPPCLVEAHHAGHAGADRRSTRRAELDL